MKQTVTKGDIFWVDYDLARATETQKNRPSLILSIDELNQNFSRVIVAPITSNVKRVYPVEYVLPGYAFVKGKVMLDQIRAVDKSRLGKKLGSITFKDLNEIGEIIKFLLGLN